MEQRPSSKSQLGSDQIVDLSINLPSVNRASQPQASGAIAVSQFDFVPVSNTPNVSALKRRHMTLDASARQRNSSQMVVAEGGLSD